MARQQFNELSDITDAIDERECELGEERMEFLTELFEDYPDAERHAELLALLKVLDSELGGDSFELWKEIEHLREVYDELPACEPLYDERSLHGYLREMVDEYTSDLPGFITIDYSDSIDNLQTDYCEIDILGETYYYRG